LDDVEKAISNIKQKPEAEKPNPIKAEPNKFGPKGLTRSGQFGETLPSQNIGMMMQKKGKLRFEEDQSLLMYWLDATEDPKRPGSVFLFGKAKTTSDEWCTVCAEVESMQRELYFFKRQEKSEASKTGIEQEGGGFYTNEEFLKEVRRVVDMKCAKFAKNVQTTLTNKKYEFELNIAHGDCTCVKVEFGFEFPCVEFEQAGKTYLGVIGSTYTATELFLIKRQIMGPCWLRVKMSELKSLANLCSRANFEVTVPSLSQVDPIQGVQGVPTNQLQTVGATPPLRVMAVSLKQLRISTPDCQKAEIALICAMVFPEWQLETDSLANKKVERQLFLINTCIPQGLVFLKGN
jgi:DNA polymerase alpha subunit A